MTQLRQRMIEDMRLNGLAPSTQRIYLNAVERISVYFGRSPEQLSEQDLRDYFTYLVEQRKIASATLRTQIFGVKFLFEKTLSRSWPTLKFLRARTRTKLPVILDRQEAESLILLIDCPAVRMAVTMMFTCGLRISEVLSLQVAHIDSSRMVVTVRAGKGNRDRHVPLPQRTLELLREYWLEFRPPQQLLVTEDGRPLADHRVRYYLKKARKASGTSKRISAHTFRHSYATILMEMGLDMRVIQGLLGHRSLKTTTLYLHMSRIVMQSVQTAINDLSADL